MSEPGQAPPTGPDAPPALVPRDWRRDLSNALLLVSVLLLGLYLAVRPVAFQFSPYSVDAALAGVAALGLVFLAWAMLWTWPPRRTAPDDGVVAALILWLALNLVGLLRSPHPGEGFPRATGAGLYALLMLAAFAIGRTWPGAAPPAARTLVAVGVTQAFLGIWQKLFELPRLRAMAAAGEIVLPEVLGGEQGRQRLYSDEIFGTFGNANSFAAFLLITSLVQLGLWRDYRARRQGSGWSFGWPDLIHFLCLLLQGYGLYISGSKGAWVAALLGVWFLAAQAMAKTAARERVLKWLTAAGVLVLALALCLGAAGALGRGRLGHSMEVRFEYWRSAWSMVREEPLLGVGLGGFGEALNQHKTARATEAREAHNDWLQLWAELGVLAPLAWGLLWYLVLRSGTPAGGAAWSRVGEARSAGPPDERIWQKRTLAIGWLFVLGGLFGFLFLQLAFGRLNAADLWELPDLLAGRRAPRGALWGALAALLTPVVFVVSWVGLGAPRALTLSLPGEGLARGFRAAIGAILVHQCVDFDMTAPAVMASVFLLGGFLLSARASERQIGPLGRGALVGWPLLAAVLIPGAVLVPLNSGVARQLAEGDEDVLRTLSARAPDARADPQGAKKVRAALKDVREDIVRSSEDALAWAPFDGEAASDLATALLALGRGGLGAWRARGEDAERPILELARERLRQAQRLRPRWPGPPLMLGHLAFELGWKARAKGDEQAAPAFFREAEEHYRRAAQLYPKAPGIVLLVGDPLLARGRVAEAAAMYYVAWRVDQEILDPNVRFASIFHDPVPGCLPRHGLDPEVQACLARALKAPDLPAQVRMGLLVRQLVAAASLRQRVRGEAGADELALRVAELNLLSACSALARTARQDGHAALFHAVALNVLRPQAEERGREVWRSGLDVPALAVALPVPAACAMVLAQAAARGELRLRAAWEKAERLQRESLARGRPDTLPEVFAEMKARCGVK